MADNGMPAGPNMDEVLYERVIHDKPWMWALVNSEFQPTPPAPLQHRPLGVVAPCASYDGGRLGLRVPHPPEPCSPAKKSHSPTSACTSPRRSGGELEEGRAYGETLGEATGRAVLDAVRPK